PVGDLESEISPGVLHKYQGRVLLVTTGACPVHCRYCFRREFPYVDSIPDKKHWQQTLDKIKHEQSIHEVIFSGGDPLMLSDARLQKMCTDIAAIGHVTTIRFHTRVPIFLPERITVEFLSWLGELNVNKVMVIHSNHANELDDSVGAALLSLRNSGVTLLNQAVLLKGINDSVEVLEALLQRLFSFQVLPYYLHQLDRVKGSAHFEVDKRSALNLIESLRNKLPGYLIPRLVEEVSGKRSKQTIVKID
ncbi:MAG: KamA family radical SAM protein, partial [Cocleimonas sp.]